MKLCVKCEIEKPYEVFTIRKDSKDGYRNTCKDCSRLYDKQRWNGERREKALQRLGSAYRKNKNHWAKKHKEWAQKNKHKINAIQAKRRSAKLNATPNWLTISDFLAIREMYKIAANFNEHVDHIVPLQGKDVCGLHVPWNLQTLPAIQNLKKGNRHA